MILLIISLTDMAKLFLAILAAAFILTTYADPMPIGGARCTYAYDCGGLDAKSLCRNSTCFCDSSRGKPDCSYQRVSKNLAGGLQFICFAGVGGIGNFVAGRTGEGVGQLIMVAPWLVGVCFLCCMLCVLITGKGSANANAEGAVAIACVCCLIATFVAGIIWCIVDAANFFNGKLMDGQGYALY